MTQTNEELREKINNVLNKHRYALYRNEDFNNCANEIMSLIPQPEQLEVKITIREPYLPLENYQPRPNVLVNPIKAPIFWSKLEALDFCKRFNLKVVNESDKDGLK